MWNSPTGESMKYCIKGYEIKQCVIITEISFAFLPLDRAPYGCFSASEINSVYLDSFKQGSMLPFVLLSLLVASLSRFFSPKHFYFCSFSMYSLGPCL